MGILLSANVGRARVYPWKDTTSAIDRRPVEGPVAVIAPDRAGTGRFGLAGDHHGGPPDQALYAYAREDLDDWAGVLGRDLPGGVFGENLTTSGVDVAGALIGERWRVGAAVLLEVSMPRTPCRTFQGWMDDPNWIKRFTERALSGTYLRVIEPGEIRAGDPITVEHRPDHDVTVALTFRAMTTESELLPRLHAADALPDHLKARVRKRAPAT